MTTHVFSARSSNEEVDYSVMPVQWKRYWKQTTTLFKFGQAVPSQLSNNILWDLLQTYHEWPAKLTPDSSTSIWWFVPALSGGEQTRKLKSCPKATAMSKPRTLHLLKLSTEKVSLKVGTESLRHMKSISKPNQPTSTHFILKQESTDEASVPHTCSGFAFINLERPCYRH